ncbi:DUF1318 domain-containing protein [Magnetococcales bacterium HHB-1]
MAILKQIQSLTTQTRSILIITLLLILPSIGWSGNISPSDKQMFQSLRQQGIILETPSGYVQPAPGSQQHQGLIQKINQQRKQTYQAVANKNGIPIAQAAQIFGAKLTRKYPRR